MQSGLLGPLDIASSRKHQLCHWSFTPGVDFGKYLMCNMLERFRGIIRSGERAVPTVNHPDMSQDEVRQFSSIALVFNELSNSNHL